VKVLVFGAGSIGSVIGALLSEENDVTLLTRGAHLEAIRKDGLSIQGVLDKRVKLNAVSSLDDAQEYDAVIITVKSYDTRSAAAECAKIASKKTFFISVQNGLGNAEILSEFLPMDNIVAGTTSMGAHRIGPGVIRYVALGEMVLGTIAPNSKVADLALDLLKSSGMHAKIVDNIEGVLWSKAIVNSAINPITAILGCENGLVVRSEALRSIARDVCMEGRAVAAACDIKLDPPDVFDYLTVVAEQTANNRSSMLLDVEFGRRTEIEEIAGKIVQSGRESGIETPVTSALLSMIRYIESRTRYQKA